MKLFKRWNTYWFRSAPLFHLAICRIVLVAFQLLYLLGLVPPYGDFDASLRKLSELPDSLYNPLPVLRFLTLPFGWNDPDSSLWGEWLYRPSFEALKTIFRITLFTGILALIGFRSNISLMLFASGNVFLQSFIYSFGEVHHPEALMMIALSVLVLSPAGKVLSVDDLWHRLRMNFEGRKFEPVNVVEERKFSAAWPLLLVQWLLALAYLSAAISKLNNGGLDWVNGYTLQYYLLQDALRWGSDFGLWLGSNHMVAWILSWIALLFEGSFFLVLFFPKLAWVYIPTGIALHTGIYFAMKAPFFHYIGMYSVFVPWVPIFKALSRRLSSSTFTKKPEILFAADCPLCIRSVTILNYFDWFDRLAFADLESQWPDLARKHPEISRDDCRREMHVILSNGSVNNGFFAFREIIWRLPAFWPLIVAFYLPLASAIGPKIYRLIAGRRSKLQRCSSMACAIHSESK